MGGQPRPPHPPRDAGHRGWPPQSWESTGTTFEYQTLLPAQGGELRQPLPSLCQPGAPSGPCGDREGMECQIGGDKVVP